MALDDFQNSLGVIAWVDDHGLARFGISDDVAIALQHADREDFVNRAGGVGHEKQYSIDQAGYSCCIKASGTHSSFLDGACSGGTGFSLCGLEISRARSKPRRLEACA